MSGERVRQRRCRVDGRVGNHQRQSSRDANVAQGHDAHGDESGDRDGETRIAGLFSRSGNAVESHVRVKTGRRARQNSRESKRSETAVVRPVAIISPVQSESANEHNHANVDLHIIRGNLAKWRIKVN